MEHTINFSIPDLSSCPLGMEVSKRVDLKHVGQIAGEFTQKPNAGAGPKMVDLSHNTRVEINSESSTMFVFVDFGLIAKLKKDSEPVVNVKTTFILVYELVSNDGLTEDHYSQFAKSNGIFNAWPYWREYVQSTTVRMGLPSLTVPVLSFYKPKKEQPEEVDKPTASE